MVGAQDLRNAKRKAEGKPAKEIQAPISITFIDKLERGLSLELVISYGGSKAWRVVTYQSGRPLSRKLGSYPTMALKEARAKARQAWEDPAKFEAQATVGSFKEIAETWIKRHVAANKLRSQSEIERILKTYVYPKWKDRPFLEIGRGEVNGLLDDIVDNHGPAQADATLAVIRGGNDILSSSK